MHENATVGELLINGDVWKGLTPQQQEIDQVGGHRDLPALAGQVAAAERRGAEGDAEKHGVQILRTPPEILIAFLKTWDEIAASEESAKNPFFKKVHDAQRAYASQVVPAKRFYFPPYSFVANYYWPEKKSTLTTRSRPVAARSVAARCHSARHEHRRNDTSCRRRRSTGEPTHGAAVRGAI